ncbi:MAG: rhodanese-like domain-containing protein [Proteobacteria bacterium]|jgi:rhodanese-related sulfurtransferase|nr:rhodanese-like domain-containing protein [Pseudomonadota bacterium]
MRGLIVPSRDALIVATVSILMAVSVNAWRDDGLPLVAQQPYRIFVPCPEPGGEVFALSPSEVRLNDERELVIDARGTGQFQQWHVPGALNVPFDFLDPVGDEVVEDLVATRSNRVVVYGDGLVPDTGEELASELSGRGMRNVHFVPGGVVAMQKRMEP